jgi:hypothetical protein
MSATPLMFPYNKIKLINRKLYCYSGWGHFETFDEDAKIASKIWV